MSQNPLQKYFRQPSIHLRLPSNGEFYTPEMLQLPPTNEVPVYPMTAIDEITYKTPDALFNGSATVEVIKSCVPSFTDPWQMLTIDLNTVLIAIRIASVGETLEISSTCPKCQATADYEVDLHALIDKRPDIKKYHEVLKIGDLVLHFRPLTYFQANDNNLVRFEEQRLAKILGTENMTEDQKIHILSEIFKNIADFSIKAVTCSISAIDSSEGPVTDQTHISEFLKNCERSVYENIKNHIVELRKMEDLDPLHIKCSDCGHEYEQPYAMDMTSFFDLGS